MGRLNQSIRKIFNVSRITNVIARSTGCYIWYSEEGPGRATAPPSLLLAVPNVAAHPSTASVPITVLLYDGPLLCCFNVAITGLKLGWARCRTIRCTCTMPTLCSDRCPLWRRVAAGTTLPGLSFDDVIITCIVVANPRAGISPA